MLRQERRRPKPNQPAARDQYRDLVTIAHDTRLQRSGMPVCRASACSAPPIWPLQRLIDQLVLLHAGFAAKALGDHGRGIMVAVAGEVADRHLRVRDAALDQPLDFVGIHRHGPRPPGRKIRQAALPAI